MSPSNDTPDLSIPWTILCNRYVCSFKTMATIHFLPILKYKEVDELLAKMKLFMQGLLRFRIVKRLFVVLDLLLTAGYL